jgi:hypothetical protein
MASENAWVVINYSLHEVQICLILHGSASQKKNLNFILAAVRTWNLTYNLHIARGIILNETHHFRDMWLLAEQGNFFFVINIHNI